MHDRFVYRVDGKDDLLAVEIGVADEPGDHQVAMLIVFDRDAVRHFPVSDHTRFERSGSLRDLVLFGPVNVPLHRLQPRRGARGDAKADACGQCGAFRHRIGNSCARDTGDIGRGGGQHGLATGEGAGTYQQKDGMADARRHCRPVSPRGLRRSNHRRVGITSSR